MSQKIKVSIIVSAVVLGITFLIWRSTDGKSDCIIDPIPGEVLNDVKEVIPETVIEKVEELPEVITKKVEELETPIRGAQ
jgi:hypothetical protein